MAKNQFFAILCRNLVFLLILYINVGFIYAKELASSSGYVRREHSLSKPFQGKFSELSRISGTRI